MCLGEEQYGFLFGLATAPAHVEDRLNDAWLQFAEENPCHKSETSDDPVEADAVMGVAADGGSHRAPLASEEFGKKKKPLKVAMEAMIRGLQKFVEDEVEEEGKETASSEECHHNVAARHNVPYPEERLKFWSDPDTELKLAKDTGISIFRMGIDWSRVMPQEPVNGVKDAAENDTNGRLVVDSVSDMVDYWVTFNEPHVFFMLTYCAGAWPGGHPYMLEVATSALPTGVFMRALHWMAVSHSKAYDYIHEQSSTSSKKVVGIAHNVSFTRPYDLFDVAAVTLANLLTLFPFVDSICDKLDFIGINYYGQEVISGAGLKLLETDENSESGRGVYPDGLFRLLIDFHERYKALKVPFIITENGVSVEKYIIRRPYLLEHLLAVYAAMLKGVPVLGYLFWTISDNWEWADGYGPKFGLVAVDRANDLARIPRPSYHLFSKVVTTGKITREDRERAWNELQKAAKEANKTFLSGRGLDEPTQRPFIERDWRFGHYEMEGPGCSSIAYGAASELGPLKVGKNGVDLQFNEFAWNQEANFLFVESPVGVGFSYTNTSSDLTKLDDTFVAGDAYNFLVNWLQRYPQFKTSDFYIAGESYAGHYVPQLAELVYDRNNDTTRYPFIDLKGFMVGNPLTDDNYDNTGIMDYAWSHSVIPDYLYRKTKQVCDFKDSSWSTQCNDVVNQVFGKYSEIDIYNIYAPKCLLNTTSSVTPSKVTIYLSISKKHDHEHIENHGLKRIRIFAEGYDPCYSEYAEMYVNRPDVQQSIHADTRGGKWVSCSGDMDGRIPVISTRYCVESLGLPLKSSWRSWFHNQQVGGRMVEYEGLAMLTVRGAGHLVPLKSKQTQ
ncbi:Beta-glucosidase-like SFR2 [Hibiscus syriacus]|uniref:Carboxypeptidase n=1 Tax=Hibiscus syriacus TaxID=106335 RepID=A0A6A3CU75_HIBSY|nr:Beta-glucosidase-like SFR2 [Hibiscus syriacus]